MFSLPPGNLYKQKVPAICQDFCISFASKGKAYFFLGAAFLGAAFFAGAAFLGAAFFAGAAF